MRSKKGTASARVAADETGLSDFTRRWKRTAILASAAATLVIVTALFILSRSHRVPALTERDTIVLADFNNTTGDAVFDDTLKQGLRVQLEQSPFLNIVSDENVRKQLRLMERSEDDRLTQKVALEVCERLGSKAVLFGSISSLGTHYVIGLKALNCDTGESVGNEQVEVDSREHVLKGLGKSASEIRKKLGESATTTRKYDAPLEQATTANLEALQAYRLGLATWSAKGPAASLAFFQRAVELDPKFAMAYARLAVVYGNISSELAVENMRKAYELREKVSERERLYIESHYYWGVTGEMERAEHVYELWQQTYPQDVVPYLNLGGGIYPSLGKYEKALEEARKGVRLEPNNVVAYEGVSFDYLLLNHLDEAEVSLQQAEERKLSSERLLVMRYKLAYMKGDAAETARLAALLGRDLPLQWAPWYSAAYHGRLRKARELFRRSMDSHERNDEREAAVTAQAGFGLIEAYLGDAQRARADDHAAALRWATGSRAQQWAVLSLALAGETTRAEELASEMNKKFPLDTSVQRYWLPTIRSAVALRRKDADKAIELLREMIPYELGMLTQLDPIYVRARAFLMQGKPSAAAAEFQKIIEHPGVVEYNPVGALARLGLAQAYALQGDTAKAKAAYQDFLALWKDADPDIPILKQAKVEYAKLQ